MGIGLLSALLASGCSTNSANTATAASNTASDTEASAQSSGAAQAAAVKLASVDAAKQAGFDSDDALTTWSEDSSTMIKLSTTGAAVSGSGAAVEGPVITITKAGTYVVSGGSYSGQIVIDAPKDAVVHLVLNGAQIKNADGPAIHVKEADKAIITLQAGTDNTVSDGAVYADTSVDAPSAAIFSKGDLTINGTGKLSVQGNANDGITSKDDLKIASGTIAVKAADDGLVGRDLIAVKEGTITVNAGGDGMKTTNDTDADKGYVAITGGTFDIISANDGIQAASSILISGGTFDITTGGGSEASTKTHQEEPPRGFSGGQPQDQTQGQPQSPQGQPQDQTQSQTQDQTQNQAGEQTQAQDQAQTEAAESESTSTKGLKAAADIAITGGEFQVDAADDAIHSNANAAIMGGQYSIASGDDGIHADTALSISAGTVNITKSYEGMESADIAISGGKIHVTASDDGVNVGGSSDDTSAGGGKGMDAPTDGTLTISGGYTYVDASGDGLDSNGSIVMNGGTVIVNGPENGGNGSLDYNGTFKQSGGLLVAAGSSGMAQAPSESSSQRALLMTFPNTLEAGTLVTLTDSLGKAVVTFAPTKTFSSVVISSPDLKAGAEYTLSTGGKAAGTVTDGLYAGSTTSGSSKVVTFTLGDKVTYLNESGVTTAPSNGGFGGGGRGPGRGRGDQSGDQSSGQSTSTGVTG
ncbi:dockerin type 1 [Paenibacillus sp. CAA11]|nr:dockerin type 1 [Paenibacillus sp. CAA11]